MSDIQKINVQDMFLNAARKKAEPVSIHIVNGYVIKNALIRSFDNYAIIAESDGKQMLIYKHAVSTVTPENTTDLFKEEGNESR